MVQWVKHRLQCRYPKRELLLFRLGIQLCYPGKQGKVAQVLWILPPMWETPMKLPAPDGGLSQIQPLHHFGE